MTDPLSLKRAGLKATLPRLRILDLFHDAGRRHLSAEDVYRLLLARGFDIGLATVYRVLSQLEQAGLVKQGRFEAGRSVYELDDGRHHDHLVCTHCGQVREFHDDALELSQERIAAELGFALAGHALVLYGACARADCEYRGRAPAQSVSGT